MFKCKACAAHLAHIDTLKARVEDLRRLAFPAPNQLDSVIVDLDNPRIEGTANSEEPEQAPVSEEQLLIDQEAAALLSGTY